MALTKGQYNQLLALLHSKDTSSAMATMSVTHPSSSAKHVSNSKISGMVTCLSTQTHTTSWIIDTGATNHMFCCPSLFSSVTTIVSSFIKLPNGAAVPVTHIGVVHLSETLVLQNVLCVPSFTFNLISAKKLALHSSCCLIFFSHSCFV